MLAFDNNKVYYSTYPYETWTESALSTKFYFIIQNSNHILFATCDDGIYKSADFGRSWSLISDKVRGNYKIQVEEESFLLYPSELLNSNTVVFTSRDSMKTISQLLLPSPLIYSLTMDSNLIYVETDIGILHSTDFGNSWLGGVTPVIFNSNSCIMTSGGDIYYFNDNGKFLINKSGDWTFSKYNNKYFSGLIRSCAVSENGRLLIYSGDYLYLTDIAGTQWQDIFKNGYLGAGRMDLDNSNFKITNHEIIYSTRSHIVITIDPRTYYDTTIRYRYINCRMTETQKTSWERKFSEVDVPKNFYVLPNGNRFLLSNNNFYECSNNENFWNVVEKLPVKNDDIYGFDNDVSNNLYLLNKSGYLFKSSDNGTSWRKTNGKFPYLGGNAELKSFSNNEFMVYFSDSIYLSSDCGGSWIDISSGLSGSITKLFKSNKNEYYAVTSEGVYKSNNIPFYNVTSRPTLVKPKNDEFISAAIESVRLVWNKTDKADSYEIMTGNKNFDKVYRYYKGITDTAKAIPASGDTVYWKVRALSGEVPGEWSDTWRYIFNGTVGIESKNDFPKEFHLFQNYPNPFNPSTKIVYELPERLAVNLVIYDFLGREVEVLINDYRDPGHYSFDWTPKNASSGIYYLRLKAGKFNAVKKLLFVK